MIDFIVPRREMRDVLIRCMKFLYNADMLADTAPSSNSGSTAGRASGSKPGKSALETKAEKRQPLSFPNPVAARSRTFPSENL